MAQQIIKPGTYPVTANDGNSFSLRIEQIPFPSEGWRMKFGRKNDLSSIPIQTQPNGFTLAKVLAILEEYGFHVSKIEVDLIEIDA